MHRSELRCYYLVIIGDPSQESLDECTKEQLLKIAAYYSAEVKGDKRLKDNVKMAIKAKRINDGIMSGAKGNFSPNSLAVSFQTHGLTFEQQKEIQMLQLDHEKGNKNWTLKNILKLIESVRYPKKQKLIWRDILCL